MSDILVNLVYKVITLRKQFPQVIVLETPFGVGEGKFDQIGDIDDLVVAAGSDTVQIQVRLVREAGHSVQTIILCIQPLTLPGEKEHVVMSHVSDLSQGESEAGHCERLGSGIVRGSLNYPQQDQKDLSNLPLCRQYRYYR